MSMCISTAQARTKRGYTGVGTRHFSWQFSHKMALVRCPCAFRLRRLAQNVGTGVGPRHFFGKFSDKTALMSVCIWTAQARTKLLFQGCSAADPSLWRSWPRSYMSLWEDVVKILTTSCQEGPCIILWAKILLTSSKGFLHDLAQVLIRRSVSCRCHELGVLAWISSRMLLGSSC